MGIESLINYDAYLNYVSSAVDIFGQHISFFNPNRQDMYGYENLDQAKQEATGVLNIATSYSPFKTKAFIDFTLRKSVMHHFNWYPENSDQLCTMWCHPNEFINQETIIRTSIPGQTSVWGDMLFSVYRIFDNGMYKTLSRFYILTPIASRELSDLLSPERYKDTYKEV